LSISFTRIAGSAFPNNKKICNGVKHHLLEKVGLIGGNSLRPFNGLNCLKILNGSNWVGT